MRKRRKLGQRRRNLYVGASSPAQRGGPQHSEQWLQRFLRSAASLPSLRTDWSGVIEIGEPHRYVIAVEIVTRTGHTVIHIVLYTLRGKSDLKKRP